MAITDTSAAKLAFKEQTAWGTQATGNYQYLRILADTLKEVTDTKQSEETTGDRNPRGPIRTGRRTEGNITFEFDAGTYDQFVEHSFMSTFGAPLAISGKTLDISAADAANGTATLTDTLTTGALAAVAAGQWIKLGGFATNAVNNGYAYVVTAGANSLGLSGLAFVDESGSGDETVDGTMLRIGTSPKYFSIERQWTGLPLYDMFVDQAVEGWQQTVQVGEIVKGSFDLLGKIATSSGSSGAGTPTAANNNVIANAIDHIKGFYLGATGTTAKFGRDLTSKYATEIAFGTKNNLAAQLAIGNLDPVGIRAGIADITGTLTMYLSDSVELAQYQEFTASSLAFRIDDGTTSYIVSFPAIRYTSADDPITGATADAIVNIGWRAEKDANGIAMQVDKF